VPKYDYFCEKCGNKEERLVDFYEAIQQCECGGFMQRQFSPQGTVFLKRWGKPKVRQKVKRMGA